MPPRKAWGSEVAVVKYRPRGNEDDLYRIIADRNGTEVTVTGEYSGSWTLDEGEFAEFLTDGSFMVNASDAVLVGHFMVSSGNCSGPIDPEMWPGMFGGSNNCSGPVSGTAYKASNMGDPAISFCTPVAQYRNDYILVAPYTYAWDVVTLVAPTWAWDTVTIGGLALPEGTAMPGSGDLSFVRMLIDDGANVIESPFAGVGAEVYGYDCRISYAYAGGLSLGAINDPPDEAGD